MKPVIHTTYDAVIGLEVHCQLATQSKIFAPEPVGFGATPNSLVAEISLGLPGVLPTLNARAVELAISAGLALGCEIRTVSRFARKNYFYPDLPKGYQISQHSAPICEHGALHFGLENDDGHASLLRCAITRIHLEEDAGKSLHAEDGAHSLLDFNRAGTPLIEIVSEPELRTPAEAAAYLRALHEIVVFLGVTDGNMQEGNLRCDANVSIRPRGAATLGTRTEIKNLNSFKFVEAAIAFEIQRQIDVVESGGQVLQETRLWDEEAERTRVMRRKEEADDYRYFPDPDLPPLHIEPATIQRLRDALPELPRIKRERYQQELGLPAYDAQVLTAERARAELFEACVARGADPKATSNLIMTELLRLLAQEETTLDALPFDAPELTALLSALDGGAITRATARHVLERMADSGEHPDDIIAAEGLLAISDDDAISQVIHAILEAEADNLARYRAGERRLFGFFMGQVMRRLSGQGDPKAVRALLQKALDA